MAFKRLSCSPIIILNKQTIRSLSISPPSNFLHLNFPPHLSPSSRSFTHIVVVASPAQALRGPNTPMPYTTCPMQLPHLRQQTDICACLLSFPGTPVSMIVILRQRWSFCAYSSWLQKPPKIAVNGQNPARSSICIFTVLACRRQAINSLSSYPNLHVRSAFYPGQGWTTHS